MAIVSSTNRRPQQSMSTPMAFGLSNRERLLGLVVIGHFLLAVLYSVLIPPWEAHDEWAHYRHAAYIAENLALPDPSQRLTTEFEFDEASQPPLYYLLAAAPMLAVDTQDGYRPMVNPYATRGTGEGGVNFVLHDFAAESWPWQGTLLALHLGRFVSVIISTAGLFVTYALVRLLTPQAPDIALVATGIQAFTPQYVFLSAVITNDILLIVLETALLYLCVRMVKLGPSLRLALAVGVVAGLALLTKYLALAILPVAAAAFALSAWLHRRRAGQPGAIRLAALSLLAPLLVLGGYLVTRSLLLTGQLLPRDPVSQAAVLSGLGGGSAPALNWQSIPEAVAYGFRTYWVSFGWGNVGAPNWVYVVWLILALVAFAGLLLWLRAQKRNRLQGAALAVVALYVVAVVALPLLRELIHNSTLLRGRYILATLPVAAWGLALGWAQISGRLWPLSRKLLLLWPAALTAALIPLLLIPAYSPPRAVAADLPALPIHARFGEAAELLSAEVWPENVVSPGQGMAVTLTWRVHQRTAEPYTLAIHLIGAGDQSYGMTTSYPGNGNAATTVWRPGDTFSDTYWLAVQDGGFLPARGQILVALFNDTGQPAYLPIYDRNGALIGDSIRIGDLRIDRPGDPVTPLDDSPAVARFGQLLLLSEARLPALPQQPGWQMPVLLRWQALNASAEPVKLTIQLLDADGNRVAGVDGEPADQLPPHLWRAGDRLHAARWLEIPATLPPGTYTVIVALYHTQDLSRLPATDAGGSPLAGDVWQVGEISVTTDH